jgi:hypothetical protein
MRPCALLLFLALTGSALAQEIRVPEIPYRSVPGFLKLPPDLYLGEVAGAAQFQGHICVLPRPDNRTSLWRGSCAAFGVRLDGKLYAKLGTTFMPGHSRTGQQNDKDDNLGCRQGLDMVKV